MINTLSIDQVRRDKNDEFMFDCDDGTLFAPPGTDLHWRIEQLVDGWSAEYIGEDVTVYTRPKLIVKHRVTGAHVVR